VRLNNCHTFVTILPYNSQNFPIFNIKYPAT